MSGPARFPCSLLGRERAGGVLYAWLKNSWPTKAEFSLSRSQADRKGTNAAGERELAPALYACLKSSWRTKAEFSWSRSQDDRKGIRAVPERVVDLGGPVGHRAAPRDDGRRTAMRGEIGHRRIIRLKRETIYRHVTRATV